MKKLRNNPPSYAEKVLDYAEGLDGLPKSNVIKLILADGWLVARPSGTEPKIKIYIEIAAKTTDAAQKRIAELKSQFMSEYVE